MSTGLNFTQLFYYAPKIFSDMRSGMSLFVVGLSLLSSMKGDIVRTLKTNQIKLQLSVMSQHGVKIMNISNRSQFVKFESETSKNVQDVQKLV